MKVEPTRVCLIVIIIIYSKLTRTLFARFRFTFISPPPRLSLSHSPALERICLFCSGYTQIYSASTYKHININNITRACVCFFFRLSLSYSYYCIYYARIRLLLLLWPLRNSPFLFFSLCASCALLCGRARTRFRRDPRVARVIIFVLFYAHAHTPHCTYTIVIIIHVCACIDAVSWWPVAREYAEAVRAAHESTDCESAARGGTSCKDYAENK